MKTSELMNQSEYKSSIKSFRKLIQRFVRKNLIGMIQFEKFTEYYLYPKELLFQSYKINNWRPLGIENNSFDRFLFFYQTSLVAQAIGNFSQKSQLKCHLDPSKNSFEFAFEPKFQAHRLLAIYTFFEGEESNLLERIGNTNTVYPLDGILIVHRKESLTALDNLKNDMAKLLRPHIIIFYLAIKEDVMSISDISNLTINSIEGAKDFKSFFQGGFEDIGLQKYLRKKQVEQEAEKELEQNSSLTLWEIIKGALD